MAYAYLLTVIYGGVRMLSLSRREEETLHFHTSDGLIAVTVRVIKGGQVKLAIDAPASVSIVRAEIDEQVQDGLSSQFLSGPIEAMTKTS
jgi:carbon storage regulator CsrA